MFRSKLEQAVDMLVTLSEYFSGVSILAVCDSWFGNNGLFAPARKLIGTKFHILSRLRSNIILYAIPPIKASGQLGRNRKYGERMGTTTEVAVAMKERAEICSVFLYGKKREVLVASCVFRGQPAGDSDVIRPPITI